MAAGKPAKAERIATGILSGLPPDARSRVRRAPQPDFIDPMLATLTNRRFSDPNWIFETKLDGERCLAFKQRSTVRLLSRNQQPLNNTYPEWPRRSSALPPMTS